MPRVASQADMTARRISASLRLSGWTSSGHSESDLNLREGNGKQSCLLAEEDRHSHHELCRGSFQTCGRKRSRVSTDR